MSRAGTLTQGSQDRQASMVFLLPWNNSVRKLDPLLDVGLSTAPTLLFHNLTTSDHIMRILSFPMCSASLLEPLRVGRCWHHQHTTAHRTVIETFTASDPSTMWTPTSHRAGPKRPRNTLVFYVLGPLCSLPISVSDPSCASGWNDSLFRAGWGRSIWLSDVPGSIWPAGQRHCQPFPQVCPSPGAQTGCHHQHWCTLWLQLISQCIEFSGSSPCDYVTGISLPPSHFLLLQSCFTLEVLEP